MLQSKTSIEPGRSDETEDYIEIVEQSNSLEE